MKEWIEEIIKQGGTVWFDVAGGAAVKPIKHMAEDFYIGECQGQQTVFHEDDVIPRRRLK
jgi:hypothetical protein